MYYLILCYLLLSRKVSLLKKKCFNGLLFILAVDVNYDLFMNVIVRYEFGLFFIEILTL